MTEREVISQARAYVTQVLAMLQTRSGRVGYGSDARNADTFLMMTHRLFIFHKMELPAFLEEALHEFDLMHWGASMQRSRHRRKLIEHLTLTADSLEQYLTNNVT